MKRPIALIAAALMAAGLATAVTAPTAEAATTGCHITYTVPSQWWTGTQGGFQANITITNFGPPLVNWTLGFDFVHPGQRVTQGWSMTWTQSGRHVTATSMWGVLETNKPFTIGFLGSWTTSNPAPTNFTINGVPCSTGPLPTATRTTATASPAPSSPAPSSPAPSSPAPTSAALSTAPIPTVSVTGIVEAGVESGCLVLNPVSGQLPPVTSQWLLIGGDRTILVPGARVQVIGRVRHDAASYCQQGYPLEVLAAKVV
ncbi:hypothetical protein GCM10009682_10970 [Luedemannella flava]|uniref:CBM2 domain-containing protein n=1 Tax=Luedemannella flava TaxID=349316 RepID=A0ABN2LJU9_9ACTN